jgi:hypothetical protein
MVQRVAVLVGQAVVAAHAPDDALLAVDGDVAAAGEPVQCLVEGAGGQPDALSGQLLSGIAAAA